jgi:hypothetical protein
MLLSLIEESGFYSRRGQESPIRRVQTRTVEHQTSYHMDTVGSFPGSKAAGLWCRPRTCI